MNPATASTFWRQAGMNYLQYLGVASNAVRLSLKEPARSRALARGTVSFNHSIGPSGVKVPIRV